MSDLIGATVQAHFYTATNPERVDRRHVTPHGAIREALEESRALLADAEHELVPTGVNVLEVVLVDTRDGGERLLTIGTERFNWAMWQHRMLYDGLTERTPA